jgi:hypothetical protein
MPSVHIGSFPWGNSTARQNLIDEMPLILQNSWEILEFLHWQVDT